MPDRRWELFPSMVVVAAGEPGTPVNLLSESGGASKGEKTHAREESSDGLFMVGAPVSSSSRIRSKQGLATINGVDARSSSDRAQAGRRAFIQVNALAGAPRGPDTKSRKQPMQSKMGPARSTRAALRSGHEKKNGRRHGPA